MVALRPRGRKFLGIDEMHCVLEMLQGYATQLEMTIVMKCTACMVSSKYFEETVI